jgi:hypothetical protein
MAWAGRVDDTATLTEAEGADDLAVECGERRKRSAISR